MPQRRILANVAVAAYVLVQLLLPLRTVGQDFFDTEGYFSWNMFANEYSCTWSYTVERRGRPPRFVDLREHVREPGVVHRLFHRDSLPAVHQWLCENVVERGGRLRASVRCAMPPEGHVDLVDATADDVCRAEGFAILPGDR